MADNGATGSLLSLMSWLSPAFPVGSFAYSHGLEAAVEERLVGNANELRGWLVTLMAQGPARNDAIFVANAIRASGDAGQLRDMAQLAEAMAGSLERHAETMLQGEAFCTAARAYGLEAADLPYPVAFGALCGLHGIDPEAAVAAWLQAFASNQIQVAIRLSVLGQTQGVALLASLAPEIGNTAASAARSTLDDLGGFAPLAEIAAMRHETQHSRLFRT